jgi:chromosome partitioning protein
MSLTCRTIAIANQKGGVGKTTTAINLSTSIALAGHSVLIIDLDPQGNRTVYEALLTDEAPEPFILKTAVENLSLIPSDRSLTGAEIELVSTADRERRLKRVVDALRNQFEFIFIDCPPSLGLLTLNALVAADAVLIPLHCEYFALEGLADLVGTMRRVRGALNPSLDIEGVLLTMYDDRTNLGQLVARDVREYFREKVFETIIPRNVRLGEAPSHGMPCVVYDARSRGAAAYTALAREVLGRRAASARLTPQQAGA